MLTKQKVRLIGDFTDAPWHPLEPARQALASILQEEFQLEATEDYNTFAALPEGRFQLCISYTDCWNRDLTREQTAGLITYVAGGGSLLVIHNGVSLQRSYELSQLIGAKFTGHPPYQPLQYVRSIEEHPLLEGIDNFQLDEEPYMFDFDTFTPHHVFLEYEFEGAKYPAGWEHHYGLGKVIYLQPGHHAPSFQSESYRKLILNSARWLTLTK